LDTIRWLQDYKGESCNKGDIISMWPLVYDPDCFKNALLQDRWVGFGSSRTDHIRMRKANPNFDPQLYNVIVPFNVANVQDDWKIPDAINPRN
jgi:hypothetical protein